MKYASEFWKKFLELNTLELKKKMLDLIVIPERDKDKIVVLSDEQIRKIALVARKRKKSWEITASRILRKAMKSLVDDKEFRDAVIAQIKAKAKKEKGE